MKVAVSGSHGLVGTALCNALSSSGHTVFRIVRSASGSDSNAIVWDIDAGTIDSAKLDGVDAVVHLAGENIAASRWTPEQKQKIKDSRIKSTRLLADAISKLSAKPEVIVSGSAIGFYGNRGDEQLTETSNPGFGFLAEVCREWEDAIAPIKAAGVRVVNLRTGVILSPKAGALNKLLPIFKLGGGGIVGDGRQYMSWVSLEDEVGVIEFAITNKTLEGPVNVVSPNPVTNAQFTSILGKVVHRPTLFPLPGFAARIILGEMADELLLASQRCQPTKLLNAGYKFEYPKLEEALSAAIEPEKSSSKAAAMRS
jgi:uncharacterized protein (TIGR01777 family)